MRQDIRRIHFIGICGTAMANLAVKMHELGYEVTGSDENVYPPMSTFLKEKQIPVSVGFRKENVAYNPDLVIIGNAVSRGNPEAEYVLDNKLRYLSLPEALKHFFLWGKRNIIVSGTHGKTTSASLLAWCLEKAEKDPSFLIGGIPRNFGYGFKIGKSPFFVLEGDEYDSAFFDKRSKFLHYLPEIVIINNIEFDHCDIFRSLDDILISFRHLIRLIPQSGLLVANGDDPHVRSLLDESFAPVETFGFRSDVTWYINNLEYQRFGVHFDLSRQGKLFGRFFVPLAGNHNVMNTVGVIVVLHHLGIPADMIQEGLSTFLSVRRRLEVRGEVNGITVYDDFAHHPTAIRETLQGLALRYPDRRIWAIFEPRTNTTRRNIFQKELPAAFELAYGVAIGRINREHQLRPDEKLDREQLRADLAIKKKPVFYHDEVEKIIDWLIPQLESGDQVVIMSNGSFDNIHEKLLARLREEFHADRSSDTANRG
jgi:UDP-N-acetylmuramate: L-alanyl-gamma-D-glutamyl-meso-diaminopimelate ligase